MISEVQRSMKDFELLVFTAPGNESCRLLAEEILDQWNPEFGVIINPDARLMTALSLANPVIDYPTSVFTSKKEECGRYRGFKEGDWFDYLRWIAGYILSKPAFNIAYSQDTEPRFSSPLLEDHSAGLYTDPITGSPLFLSHWKFESSSGWPSFVDAVEGALSFHQDNSLGMRRVEVRSTSSGIHLGHLFDDGPPPTGRRFCINGAVLGFLPEESGDAGNF